MPFKGVHGHTRHTHEDKVEAKKPKEKKPKNPQQEEKSAVRKEVELYNTIFEPLGEDRPAHYVNRFFRRAGQTVVHCVLGLSPHFYIHSDELFDWMMPYERMGCFLWEEASDYVARAKTKQAALKTQTITPSNPMYKNNSQLQDNNIQQLPYTASMPSLPTYSDPSMASGLPYPTSCASHSCLPPPPSSQVSSIFPHSAVNPGTGGEVPVSSKNPSQPLSAKVSRFNPPFLIIDSRREDEFAESHIHGAYNIHYVTRGLEYKLPDWVEKDTPIITYCAVGLRSGLMVWELRKKGYRFVKVLSGGYYKWVNEGRPIYAGSGELTEKVLQQHKLAGIMLKSEMKKEMKKLERKQQMDARVADHHAGDSSFPQCHTYKPYDDQGKRKSVLTVQPRRRSSAIFRSQANGEYAYGNRRPTLTGSAGM